MQDQNRVVIAGMGLVQSAGTVSAWSGGCGACYLTISDQDIQDALPGISVRSVDRQSIFAGIAVRRAVAAYWEGGGLKPDATGVVLGTTFGAVTSIGSFYRQALREGFNATSPMEFPNTVANAPASRVGIWFGFKGPNVTLADGLVSGLDAVGYAYDAIRYQKAEFYLAGDTEGISDTLFRGYAETSGQCPQDSNHVTEVIGEGAGGLYLCSRDAALAANYRIDAEIVGFYSGGSPLTADWGRQSLAGIDALLAEAGICPADIVVYTSVRPFNPAAGLFLQATRRQFGLDRVVTPDRENNQSFQYFGLNGISNVMRATADLQAVRYRSNGALIVEADWDGRLAAILLI